MTDREQAVEILQELFGVPVPNGWAPSKRAIDVGVAVDLIIKASESARVRSLKDQLVELAAMNGRDFRSQLEIRDKQLEAADALAKAAKACLAPAKTPDITPEIDQCKAALAAYRELRGA